MEEKPTKMFALVGKNIAYSFSKKYFTEKFSALNLHNHQYVNFDISSIEELPQYLTEYKDVLQGMNVTIPYKEAVIPMLSKLSNSAQKIGAVNTIKVTKKGKLKGFNTDAYGFEKSLKPMLKKHHTKALILGTGGASKAVAFVLKKLKISYKFVSRSPKNKEEIGYNRLKKNILKQYTIIINCTPLGTHPKIENYPNIPYEFITKNHLLYDLIYNPVETTFLIKGKAQGATIKNGMEMLELQAEKAWAIWNKTKP